MSIFRSLTWYGWLGLAILVGAEALMLARQPFVSTWFTPIEWTGYILLADALILRKRGASLLPSDYQLNGFIEEIEEAAAAGACSAHLRLRATLLRVRPGKGDPVLLQRAYGADEPCPCNQPGVLAS